MQRQDYILGRTALITGISKGIGEALAKALLERGASVVGWGLHAPGFSHKHLHFFPCDVSDEAAVELAWEATRGQVGGIDFLVNNAGFGYFSPIESFDAGQFRRMWEVNVLGAFLVTRALVPHFKVRGSGHVVNISSIAGKVGAPQGEGYNASKFALTGMTECLFQELRRDGIKVTTVFPGSTDTGFFDGMAGVGDRGKMLDAGEVAGSIVHVLDSSANYLVREIEIRPLNTK
jgi:NAD(P)-dependent dehydrogenase (short-subunit alcohol dehydrogenase family)